MAFLATAPDFNSSSLLAVFSVPAEMLDLPFRRSRRFRRREGRPRGTSTSKFALNADMAVLEGWMVR